ncbi:hypothetical protein BCR35DRAFT_304039 [Leucosporidium creatinivorum]|uniref:Proteophosphoglycan ppg4 n=1 Tax=Leucosporidium creatinivorum TaxID=106004 RepID=A0A1Y2FEX7_9BASI|nr:hypothetical protein BCR35DRAFT_304039 [Leucosporidium creatinivorum]
MDRLPTELKAHIVQWVSRAQEFDEDGPRVVSTSLLHFAECSKEFAALAHPFIFERVPLLGPKLARLEFFAETIAPKYGKHIRDVIGLFHQADGEVPEDEVEEELEVSEGTKEKIRSSLGLFASAVSHLTRLQHLHLDVASGNPPLGLPVDKDPLSLVASTIGRQLQSLHLSRMSIGDPNVDPRYLAGIISQCPNLELVELTAIKEGDSAADEDAFFDSLRSLKKLESLLLMYCDVVSSRMGSGEWLSPLRHLDLRCNNRLRYSDVERVTRPFKDSLTRLKIVHVADMDDDIIPPSPSPPSFDLPHLRLLDLDTNFPLTWMSCFQSSPLKALVIASLDSPSVDPLGEEVDSFIGAFKPFVKEDGGGLAELAFVDEDWAPNVKIAVAEWGEKQGIKMFLKNGSGSDDEGFPDEDGWETDEEVEFGVEEPR